MKLFLSMLIGFYGMMLNAQQTYIPDDNFEQRLIDLGYDNEMNDSVLTANIDTVTSLTVGLNSLFVQDLTGIESFVSLKYLNCSYNELTSLDLSNNVALEYLYCFDNELTTLDVSNNTALIELDCSTNDIVELNTSNNLMLKKLYNGSNDITNLDLSGNQNLEELRVYHNELTSLNLANGNNQNISTLQVENNPDLICIQVDDMNYSNSNWIPNNMNFSFDSNINFSENCEGLSIQNIQNNLIDLYPNPARNFLNVNLKTNGQYRIYTTLGESIIESRKLNEGVNQIDLSDLNSGFYFIELTSDANRTQDIKNFMIIH